MPDNLIFIVDDEDTHRELLYHWITAQWGYPAKMFPDGTSCLNALEESPDLVLLDIMMPGISGIDTLKEIKERLPDVPVIMMSAQGNIGVAVSTIQEGATDYFEKPIDYSRLEVAIKNSLKLYDLNREVVRLRDTVKRQVHFDNIVSQSGEMQDVFRLVHKVKDKNISVLILGESGTGKELIARAMHFNGKRKNGPFVVVNCASIPRDLLESEMFGHEKGAFTGATQRRIGKFEQAHGGTIFLDEVGELDFDLQAKLLRVIESNQFERVGGSETITTDARLVSATNRDLHVAVGQKTFREDLYYRLAVFPIVLPPLRQRPTDILLLAEHFLREFGKAHAKQNLQFSPDALRLLMDYSWPGNVREMENAIERAVVIAETDRINDHDLPLSVQTFGSNTVTRDQGNGFFRDIDPVVPMEKLKEQAIRHALTLSNGSVAEVARKLKVGRATLYRLMRKYKITA
jgi:two-component system response regulator AtoC